MALEFGHDLTRYQKKLAGTSIRVTSIIDTNGAGDAFVGGFLSRVLARASAN